MYKQIILTLIILISLTKISFAEPVDPNRITQGNPNIPSAPALSIIGAPGNSSAPYFIVCHDSQGNISSPSKSTIINTIPNVLNTSNEVQISWTNSCTSVDVLKYSVNTAIVTGATGTNALDSGQTLIPYTPIYPPLNGAISIQGPININKALATFPIIKTLQANDIIDLSQAAIQEATLTTNSTITLVNLSNGQNLTLDIIQDINGGHAVTLQAPTGYTLNWTGNVVPTISTIANTYSTFTFHVVGTNIIGTLNTNNTANSIVLFADNYGCKGNGTTDDALCIYNATTALNSKPNQTLQFTAGKTYFVNSKPHPPWVSININNNNETLDFNGATLLIGSAVTSSAFGGGGGAGILGYNQFPQYPVNSASRGANFVTTTTATDAGNFSVGSVIYLAGPLQASSHCYLGENIVEGADATTGIIQLQRPLGKTYPTLPIVSNVTSSTTFGFTIKNAHVRWQNGCHAQFYSGGEAIGGQFLNNDIDGSNCNISEPIQLNSVMDTLWQGNVDKSLSTAGPFEAGGLGSINSRFINNTGINLGISGGIFGSLEGTEGFTAIGNYLSTQGGYSGTPGLTALISLASTYDSVVSNNTIRFGGVTPAGNVAAISTGGTSCPEIGSIISDNVILAPNLAEAINSQAGDTIKGNYIETNKNGIQLHDVSTGYAQVVTGNSIYSANGKGIVVSNFRGPSVTGNYITGLNGTACAYGIEIDDPGSVSSTVPIIAANSTATCTNPVLFVSKTDLPLAEVFGNGYPASNLNTPLVVPAHLATFGTCASALEGQLRTQDDSAVACVQGVLAAAGGSTHCQIYCNGSTWNRTGL